jgi:hypothetical protein
VVPSRYGWNTRTPTVVAFMGAGQVTRALTQQPPQQQRLQPQRRTSEIAPRIASSDSVSEPGYDFAQPS